MLKNGEIWTFLNIINPNENGSAVSNRKTKIRIINSNHGYEILEAPFSADRHEYANI